MHKESEKKMKNYNEVAFTPEDVEKGLDRQLLDTLLYYNREADAFYNDIHLWTDGYCHVISWTQIPFDGSLTGKFKYVDEDEYVVKNYKFPDGHCELCFDDEDYKERLETCANPLPDNLNEEE